MRVCLFRHGPALLRGTEGIADDERPLTPEGRTRTGRAARGIRRLKLGIDGIWTSPLPRARQTAEILARELRLSPPTPTELLAQAISPAVLRKLLAGLTGACPVLVGHEPWLGETAALLTGARSDAFPMKKAGLAVLDLVRKGPRPAAALRLYLSPSALRALGSA